MQQKKIGMMFMGLMIAMVSMGCVAPGVVRLADKPFGDNQIASHGTKVALIVRDERPEAIQKANMCGVNNQTIFRIPVAPMFLGHLERLDSVVAYHAAKRLNNAGYEVVSSFPDMQDRLSDTQVKASHFKNEKKAAWAERKNQTINKAEKKEARALGKKKGIVQVESTDQTTVSPWGEELNVDEADAVVELKIQKFWTDYSYFGSVSWMSVNLAVCSAGDELRRVLYGNKLKGGGYMFSFFTPLTPSSDATVSANTAYWFVLNGLEKEFAKPGILTAVRDDTAMAP